MSEPADNFLVFVPALDFNVVKLHVAECIDKCSRKSSVSNQRHVQIDSCTPDFVAVGKLPGGKILRDVHDQVNLLVVQEVECLWLLVTLAGPVHQYCRHPIVVQELVRAACGI